MGVAHKRVIPSSSGVGSSLPAAALEALLSGPTNDQLSEGLSSAIPAGVRLMNLSVSGGTAVANLSSTFSSGAGVQPSPGRIGEVVFTLTQFPAIQQVLIQVNAQTPPTATGDPPLGQPVDRAQLDALLPGIFVESPASADDISAGTIDVSGLTDVAQFTVEVIDSTGTTVVNQVVNTNATAGTWVPFSVVAYLAHAAPGPAQLQVFSVAADGSHTNVLPVPLMIG